jgi:hypothetical protein
MVTNTNPNKGKQVTTFLFVSATLLLVPTHGASYHGKVLPKKRFTACPKAITKGRDGKITMPQDSVPLSPKHAQIITQWAKQKNAVWPE